MTRGRNIERGIRRGSGDAAQHDLDAPPKECAGLKNRAFALLYAARAFLELD